MNIGIRRASFGVLSHPALLSAVWPVEIGGLYLVSSEPSCIAVAFLFTFDATEPLITHRKESSMDSYRFAPPSSIVVGRGVQCSCFSINLIDSVIIAHITSSQVLSALAFVLVDTHCVTDHNCLVVIRAYSSALNQISSIPILINF